MIEISDDRIAAEKAEFLIRRLNYDKKMRELEKVRKMEKFDEQVKLSIDDIRNDRIEKQDRVKYDKQSNIFERLEQHEKKKLNLVSSEFNNAAFIKGLYKGAHYNKPLRNFHHNKVILPHLPQDLYSVKIPKKTFSPAKPIYSPMKSKLPKEFLAGKIEREEKILIEREKILKEEKKILEARKKQFETKKDTNKIKKELEDIEKALFNYQSLKKFELSPIDRNNSQDNRKEEKFLEYKNELKGWGYEHYLGKSESPEKKNLDFKIKKKICKGIQANAWNIDEIVGATE